MPPFQYTPYHNPFVGSISQLIEAPGQIEAQRALNTAQGWQQAIQGVTGAVGNAITQATDPRRQLEAQQVTANKNALAFNSKINSIVANLTKQNPDGSRTLDRAQLQQQFAAANVPAAMQEQTFKSLDDVDASISKFQQAKVDHLADLAHGVLEAGGSPDSLAYGVALAKANGLVTDEQVAPIVQAAANGRDIKPLLMQMRSQSEKYKELSRPVVLPPTPEGGAPATLVTPTTGTIVATGGISQTKPVVVPEGGTVYDPVTREVLAVGGPKALDEFQTFKQDYPKTLGKATWAELTPQQQGAALGVYKEQTADPEIRAAALAQKNLAQMLAQAQVNQMPTADQAKSVADDLVHHRLAPEQLASFFSTRGKEGLAFKLAVTSEAKKMAPTFNFEEAAAEYALTRSPQFQNTVRYMNSTLESMPQLLKNAQALGNVDARAINQAINAGKNQINNVDLKKFKTDTTLVGDEIAKILTGGGTGSATSDVKLKQAQDLLGTSDSPKAIAATLAEIQTLLGYRRGALTKGTYMENAAPATPAHADYSIKRTPVK